MYEEASRRYHESDQLRRTEDEVGSEEKKYTALKAEFEGMPKGEDPKETTSWIEGPWDMSDPDSGKWITSLQIDPVRTAWERKKKNPEFQLEDWSVKLGEWSHQIERGLPPDFGPYAEPGYY